MQWQQQQHSSTRGGGSSSLEYVLQICLFAVIIVGSLSSCNFCAVRVFVLNGAYLSTARSSYNCKPPLPSASLTSVPYPLQPADHSLSWF